MTTFTAPARRLASRRAVDRKMSATATEVDRTTTLVRKKGVVKPLYNQLSASETVFEGVMGKGSNTGAGLVGLSCARVPFL